MLRRQPGNHSFSFRIVLPKLRIPEFKDGNVPDMTVPLPNSYLFNRQIKQYTCVKPQRQSSVEKKKGKTVH